MRSATVEHVVELARRLSPKDRRKVIQRLSEPEKAARLEVRYENGYRSLPEDVADIEALMPHLPVPRENWE